MTKRNKTKPDLTNQRRKHLDDPLKTIRGGYVGVNATSFKDFLLKDELLRAINEAGFENPS